MGNDIGNNIGVYYRFNTIKPFLNIFLHRVINIPLTDASDSPKIAAWHMTPTEVTLFLTLFSTSYISHNDNQEKASKPTVLYLHGVAHTRGYPHRVDLYKVAIIKKNLKKIIGKIR